MKKLNDFYKQNLPVLQKQLESAVTISEVAGVVEDELRRLADTNGEYIGDLTKAQARIALSMLEAFRLSFSILAKNQTQLNDSTHDSTAPKEHSHDDQTNSLDGALGGFAGGAVGGAIIGGPVGGAVGAVLGAFVATVFTKSRQLSKPSQDIEVTKTPAKSHNIQEPDATLDKGELLSYLEQIFDMVDYTVAEYSRLSEPEIPKLKLENHPEVLEFMQDFMGEVQGFGTQLPPIFQLRLKELSSILRKYGIRSQVYQDVAADAVNELFDFEPSLDASLQNYVMVKPAFIKGDSILLRGRIIEPNSSKV
jgi:uncharacterized membrane protein